MCNENTRVRKEGRSTENTESYNDLKPPKSGEKKKQTKKPLHTQQAQYTTSEINGTRVTPRHIIGIVKMLKDEGKKKLEIERREMTHPVQKNSNYVNS